MKGFALVMFVVLLITAGGLSAAEPCETNYKQEGSFFGGRQFTTWDELPTVTPDKAFKRIYTEGVKSGLKVANSDKDMGIISFETNQVLDGAQVTLPWNVVIEESGEGSKISVTRTTPPTYPTGKGHQIKSMCSVIDAARQ